MTWNILKNAKRFSYCSDKEKRDKSQWRKQTEDTYNRGFHAMIISFFFPFTRESDYNMICMENILRTLVIESNSFFFSIIFCLLET